MAISENKAVHETVSLNYWATRAGLIPEEAFLIERYLDKELSTVEAGTGGGRILFEMRGRGFTNLIGFDHVPGLIAAASKKDVSKQIKFSVQDAVSLNYADEAFDQAIYLQQIICMIEGEALRLSAFKESYRVLKSGGTALFSFLSFEARCRSPLYKSYLAYLKGVRAVRLSSIPIQYLPWMRLGGRFNWRCLVDSPPYVYWYRVHEAVDILQEVGFRILAIGSSYQIENQVMLDSLVELKPKPIAGMLYIVGQK